MILFEIYHTFNIKHNNVTLKKLHCPSKPEQLREINFSLWVVSIVNVS